MQRISLRACARPGSQWTMRLKKGEVSVLDYDSMNVRDLPERMFTREYLRKLE